MFPSCLCLDIYSHVCRSSVQTYILKHQRKPSLKSASRLHKQRAKLQTDLDEFLANVPFTVDDLSSLQASFDADVDSDDGGSGEDLEISAGDQSDLDQDAAEDESHPSSHPEKALLPLPSYLVQDQMSDPMIAALAKEELHLRQLSALDALHHLRLSLGLKSAMFRKSIAPAKSQKTQTRAWRSLKKVEADVKHHAQAYRRARQGLVRLRASQTILAQFQELKQEDLKMSRDVIEENRVGQRSEHVSWIWRLDGVGGNQNNPLLMESE
jgi:hypothetical protein